MGKYGWVKFNGYNFCDIFSVHGYSSQMWCSILTMTKANQIDLREGSDASGICMVP